MNCMKCGRENQNQQAFCDICLAGMEKSPVEAGTTVNLPPVYARLGKRPNEKQKKPEDVIFQLEGRIHRLSITIMFLVLLLAIALGTLAWTLISDSTPVIGQNYSTMIDGTNP